MNILLVDDMIDIHMTQFVERLENILRHRVTYATSADEALSAISQQKFDLVFIDEQMPEKDGLSLGKEISANEQLSHIPLIMLTNYDQTNYAVPALTECGFSYFIYKPLCRGANIEKTLLKIELLPSVQIKRKMRTMNGMINYYQEELNKERKNSYLKNFEAVIKEEKSYELVKTITHKLDCQEQILDIIDRTDQLPRVTCTMNNLGAGISLLEQKKEVNTSILKELSKKDEDNNKAHGLSKDPYGTLKVYFQLKDRNGVYTKNALITMGLFYNNPDNWKNTKSKALNRLQSNRRDRFYTITDDIILEISDKLSHL